VRWNYIDFKHLIKLCIDVYIFVYCDLRHVAVTAAAHSSFKYSVLYILNDRFAVMPTQSLCEMKKKKKNTGLTSDSNLKITKNIIGKSSYTVGKVIEAAFQITIIYWIKPIFQEDTVISKKLVS